jgi:hypothetical protein
LDLKAGATADERVPGEVGCKGVLRGNGCDSLVGIRIEVKRAITTGSFD